MEKLIFNFHAGEEYSFSYWENICVEYKSKFDLELDLLDILETYVVKGIEEAKKKLLAQMMDTDQLSNFLNYSDFIVWMANMNKANAPNNALKSEWRSNDPYSNSAWYGVIYTDFEIFTPDEWFEEHKSY